MLVEILYFDDCPNYLAARELVERISSESGIEQPEIRMVEVPDAGAAERLRFLGSPTIRVNGIDIEPNADRNQFVLACRLYATSAGIAALPDEQWLRAALSTAE